MNIYIASNNKHKIAEFAQILNGANILPASAIVPQFAPEENGADFAANALIKARALAAYAPASSVIIADDSGLCVDALNGAPGVRSARFANDHNLGDIGDDEANKKALAHALAIAGLTQSNARFVCALAVISGGEEQVIYGYLDGVVKCEEAGSNGFGYDSMFYPHLAGGLSCAELSAKAKNAISHRAMALERLKSAMNF